MAYHYVKKRGNEYVIVNKSGRVLSRHSSKAKADASFRAMEASKHGDKMRNRRRRG